MATTPAYTDLQGRKITQTAYDAQKNAGTDVSGYKPIAPVTTVAPTTTPTITPTTTVAPTPTVTPVVTTDTMAKIKELPQYSELLKKGYTEEQISKAVSGYKPPKTTEPTVTPPAEVKTETPATAVAPTTTTTAKPEELKTPKQEGPLKPLEISEYQDNSTERQNQIVSNLNQYRGANPEYMKDIDTFRNTFSYGIRSPEQKTLLDNRYSGYKKGLELDNMSVSDLADRYGTNITSTDLEQLKLQNPTKYGEVKDTIEKKKVYENLKGELYETPTPKSVMAQLDSVSGDSSIFDEYKKVINSEEVKGLQTSLADKEGAIKQLQLDLTAIKNNVEKEFEGTGATRTKINAIIADQQTDINNKISALSIDYQTGLDKYNSIVNTAKDTMELGIKQQEADRAARTQKMSELGFYYQYDPKGMTEMAETKYNIDNPDIDSTDPVTARRALNNELSNYYKQYGDIIIRPQSQALNDIIAQSKKEGLSLSQALKKNFTDPLQAKSLYSAKVAKNMGIDMGKYNLTQSKDGNWNISAKNTKDIVTVNGVSYYKDANGNLSNIAIPETPYTQQKLNEDIVDTGLKNVYGSGVKLSITTNNMLQGAIQTLKSEGIDIKIGDSTRSHATQQAAYDKWVAGGKKGPQVAKPGTSFHEIGQAFDLSQSQMNDPKIIKALLDAGFTRPVASEKFHRSYGEGTDKFGGATTSGKAPTDAEIISFNDDTSRRKMSQADINRIATAKSDIMKNPNSSLDSILKYSQGGKSPTDTISAPLIKYQQALDQIESLSKDIVKMDTGPFVSIINSNNPYNVKAQEIKAKLTALVPNLARGVYGEVGVLTDNDISNYIKTIPNLSSTKDVNKALLAMTLDSLSEGYKKRLSTVAGLGYDVSGLAGAYDSIKSQANDIRTVLGIGKAPTIPEMNYNFGGGTQIGSPSRMNNLSSLVV